MSQLTQPGGSGGGGGVKFGGIKPNIYLNPGILKLDPSTPVTDIPGIGALDASTLTQNGIETLEQLGASDSTKIGQLLNVSPDIATSVIAKANVFAQP